MLMDLTDLITQQAVWQRKHKNTSSLDVNFLTCNCVSCQTLPKMLSLTDHIKECAAILTFKRFSLCFLEQNFVLNHINKHFLPPAACSQVTTAYPNHNVGPVVPLLYSVQSNSVCWNSHQYHFKVILNGWQSSHHCSMTILSYINVTGTG